jgi:hypothetical protein
MLISQKPRLPRRVQRRERIELLGRSAAREVEADPRRGAARQLKESLAATRLAAAARSLGTTSLGATRLGGAARSRLESRVPV